jgi:dsRNA-specific ribonuclease
MDNPNNRLILRQDVEDILNYFENIGDNGERLVINNLEYYQQAFTHESYYQAVQNQLTKKSEIANIYINYLPRSSSERLEYLGDHILKAIAGRYLYRRFEDEREGFLTKLKIKIEKCSMLHKIANILGFKKFLLLSIQVENQTVVDLDRGRNTPSYCEDSFEAFIGAILEDFGDKGYIYADRFVISVIENIIDFAELISKNDNFKDSLQRYFQSLKWKTPVYFSVEESGPIYRKVFTRTLFITSQQFTEVSEILQKKIYQTTLKVLEFYKKENKQVYENLLKEINNGNYILGIGMGRKVVNAEQECAKNCMYQLGLELNY